MDPDGDPNDALPIPIDPALGGAQPDSLSPPVASQAPPEHRKPDPYDFQAPHGDPFDPEPDLFPIPEPPPPPPLQNIPKGQKRKRKAPPRENECPLCGGNENRNTTTGEPKVLLTCQDCSRSGVWSFPHSLPTAKRRAQVTQHVSNSRYPRKISKWSVRAAGDAQSARFARFAI